MIIVITPEEDILNETSILNSLFENGLEILHLRKPHKNYEEHIAYLKEIDSIYHNRIMVHYFHELTNDYDLKGFYKNARLFVYPSLYEGFGIPIIEAMSCGAPVCVSNIDVFKEVCGNNAVYFNPKSTADIKDKIILSINKPKQVFNQLDKYSWTKSASFLKIKILELEAKHLKK